MKPDPLIDALVQVSFATMAILNKIGADHDLSLTQLRVLGILRDRTLRMTELAGYLGLEKSTMSGLVDRAEERGLLQRASNVDDRRAVDVFLTRAGAALFDRGYARVREELSPLIGRLSADDRRRVHALLAQMLGSPD
jgi:DNA-binding MarR family transcriptional regulator